LARGVWLTGFGWGAVAYAQLDGPLMAYAPWIGMYGLCALVAWLVMTVAQAVRSRSNWVAVSLAAVALVAPVVGGAPWASTTSAGRLEVTLLQGNIPQDEKFEPGSGVPLALQWYHEQLLASRTSLVIAPETAIPLLPQQLRPDYWPTLQNRFATGDQAALIGMPLGNYEAGYTNSVVGILPGQETLWRYDKQHLVPFGEFIPPLFKWFTEMMNIPLGDFNRGAKKQALFDWQGQRLALNICYEDLFGEELGLQFSDPAQTPTVFVNVSNLAWFGNSLAMDQHLHIARMRALEFARPFVLATNTGATAIVDYQGRVVSALARDTRGVLVTEVEGREGVTPFATWVARFGLWPYWALIGVVLSLAAWGALRKRQVAAIQPA
jgi:apolipoprotein N-acyltransferase